jgi:hypothetical protein
MLEVNYVRPQSTRDDKVTISSLFDSTAGTRPMLKNDDKQEASRILAEQIAEFKANGGAVRVISIEESDARRLGKKIIK